ncbi:MAG: DUF418 domain-containing protein [Gemmatimonadales bacterium]|nr:DUF418 domain-containing protein [Gemmatimonadales bacterium]NIN12749.1 DUF418 domain-containing protein [Gemmatimonadales bacterium]NIQ99652.1 DUF418 domain-containing protein [Gemmatimonadales bacterium]
MNIQGFAMPQAAYLNPTVYGELAGLNGWVWRLSHLLTDQKFLTIFSLLFGAGIVLMGQRLEAKGFKSPAVHYRRTLGLLIIGLLHAYLLWQGDILVTYALCALVVFWFRRVRPKTLLTLGILTMAVYSVFSVLFAVSMPYWPSESMAALQEVWRPTPEMIRDEVAAYQSDWLAQMEFRVPGSLAFQTIVFATFMGWRAAGLMLIGMALYKWGVLTGARSRPFYVRTLVGGLAVGLPIIAYGMARNSAEAWSVEYSMYLGSQFNYWGAPLVSLSYVAVVMLVCRSPRLTPLTRPFAAVGRTALSNYLLQTIVCTTLFYGHGLGLFGQVSRVHQFLVCVAVWVFQVLVTLVWLRYFRFGPLEWLWRSATYLRFQPLRS